MNLNDLFADDAADILINADEFAEEIQFINAAGAVSTINAVLEWQPSRPEQRANHRVRVEPVQVSANFVEIYDGSAARLDDGALFDFIGITEQSPGIITAHFERVTILDTGTETGDI